MNGQDAAIQPMVPQSRIGPNCRAGSLIAAKAMEFVIEIVGT